MKKDSSFALAYAGVADASLVMYRETKDSFWSAKALGAAQQARALNEDQLEIHLALGSVYRGSGRTAEAIVELKRALEIAPNSDEAYRRLGEINGDLGNRPEAIAALDAHRGARSPRPFQIMVRSQRKVGWVNICKFLG